MAVPPPRGWSIISVDGVVGDVEILMWFQEGLGNADYVYVLLEKKACERWFLVEDALGVPG